MLEAKRMRAGVLELSLADYTQAEGPSRGAFSRELMRGLQRFGFIILRDHGISTATLDTAYSLCAALFAQPEQTKRRYVAGPRGYAPFRTEHAKNSTQADLKEFWQIGPEPAPGPGSVAELPNVWPESLPHLRPTFLALFDALQDVGETLLEALSPQLSLPATYFEPLLSDRNSVLRLIHYPPVAADAEPGSTRAAAHEDINLLTLLPAPQGSGLELLDRDGQWLALESRPGDLIVDSGDMMAVLTNDVIPATTHRVVMPSTVNTSRYSMPFFMHPNADVMLSCLPSCRGSGAKYPDIRAGEFLEQRLRAIGLLRS